MANFVDLSNVALSVDKNSSVCGSQLTYTLVTTNRGNTTANNVVLVNTIPTGTTFVNDSVFINGVQKVGLVLQNTISVGSIPAGQTLTVSYKVAVRCSTDTAPSSEVVTIYRKCSVRPGWEEELKNFWQWFHFNEPLGIEILQPTDVTISVEGTKINGAGNLVLHDVNNYVYLTPEAPIGTSKTIRVPSKGELFIRAHDVYYSGNQDLPFSFNVRLSFTNRSHYKITPTFDIRPNKLFKYVITDEALFRQKALEVDNDGLLLISENIRIYMPLAKYVPRDFQPTTTLNMHELIVRTYNVLAGLDINAPLRSDKPRRNFVLNSPRANQVGYMSAGSTCIDAHPRDSFEFFHPNWGLFHEYGHLYDQGIAFWEISNNLYSKVMEEMYGGFTWLWGPSRSTYESQKVLREYNDYKNNVTPMTNDFRDVGIGLYALILLTENLTDFVPKLWTYFRNNPINFEKAEAHAIIIAIVYKVNTIPYFEMYRYIFTRKSKEIVLQNSTSSAFYIPANTIFDSFRGISVTPTVRSLYAGANSILSGIANPNAVINVKSGQNVYTTNADSNSKFQITIPETLSLGAIVTVTSTELNKTVSKDRTVKVNLALDEVEITFASSASWNNAIFSFDTVNKKFVVSTGDANPNNTFAGQVYYSFFLYDVNNNLKASAQINGNAVNTPFKTTFDALLYQEGDYIKLTHKEKATKLKITGTIDNTPADLSLGFGTIDEKKARFTILNGRLIYSVDL